MSTISEHHILDAKNTPCEDHIIEDSENCILVSVDNIVFCLRRPYFLAARAIFLFPQLVFLYPKTILFCRARQPWSYIEQSVVRWWMMPQLGKRTNYHSPWQLWFPFKILGSGRLKFSAAGSSCYLRHSVSVRLSIVWPSGRLALSRGENGERSDAIWNCLWLSYWAYPKLFELIWDYCGRSRQSLKMKTGMPSDFTPLSNNFINPKGTISHNENIGTYTQSNKHVPRAYLSIPKELFPARRTS